MSAGTKQRAGYLALIRSNPNFSRLLAGQVISQTGDWFNGVALFTLLLELTGKGESVAYVLIIKLLPSFFVGPAAGVVADRFNRKAILILTDVVRGILAFGFLFIDSPDEVWLVYALTALQVVCSTFFEPAKSAAIPGIVPRDQLVTANAISGATWSVTQALGAGLGGITTDAFGRNSAFIIDALSFFVSAVFIARARFGSSHQTSEGANTAGNERTTLARLLGIDELIEGFRYLKKNPRVRILMLVKAGWGLGGGVLLLLTVYGKSVFPLGRDGAASIGLLYAARGIGTLIGPVVTRRMAEQSVANMRRAISSGFFISTAFYLFFAQRTGTCGCRSLCYGSARWRQHSMGLLDNVIADERARSFSWASVRFGTRDSHSDDVFVYLCCRLGAGSCRAEPSNNCCNVGVGLSHPWLSLACASTPLARSSR